MTKLNSHLKTGQYWNGFYIQKDCNCLKKQLLLFSLNLTTINVLPFQFLKRSKQIPAAFVMFNYNKINSSLKLISG